MDINEGFATEEDIIKMYTDSRPTVTVEDTRDLLRIFKKYLKQKLKSGEFYAMENRLGVFYREMDVDSFIPVMIIKTNKTKTEEKLMLNTAFKKSPLREYNYNEFELLKENTNNRPIKN